MSSNKIKAHNLRHFGFTNEHWDCLKLSYKSEPVIFNNNYMTSKYQFGYRYSKLEMKYWVSKYKTGIIAFLIVYTLLLTIGVLNYKSEEKFNNEQITWYSNQIETIKFINKNY